MKIMLLNGPSINMMNAQNAAPADITPFEAMIDNLKNIATKKGHMLSCFQSNFEGQLIDWIQQARQEHYDGIIINPGALSHYSYALRDAIGTCGLPCIEVSLGNIFRLEEGRRNSVTANPCLGQISGFGVAGYVLALDALSAVRVVNNPPRKA